MRSGKSISKVFQLFASLATISARNKILIDVNQLVMLTNLLLQENVTIDFLTAVAELFGRSCHCYCCVIVYYITSQSVSVNRYLPTHTTTVLCALYDLIAD